MPWLGLVVGALAASAAWDLWRLARHARWPEAETLLRGIWAHPLLWRARLRHDVRSGEGETWVGTEWRFTPLPDLLGLRQGQRLRRRYDPADRGRIVEFAPGRTAGLVGIKLGLAGFAWVAG